MADGLNVPVANSGWSRFTAALGVYVPRALWNSQRNRRALRQRMRRG